MKNNEKFSIQEVTLSNFFKSKNINMEYSIFQDILKNDLLGEYSYAIIKKKDINQNFIPMALLKYEKNIMGGDIISLSENTRIDNSDSEKMYYSTMINDFLEGQTDVPSVGLIQ